MNNITLKDILAVIFVLVIMLLLLVPVFVGNDKRSINMIVDDDRIMIADYRSSVAPNMYVFYLENIGLYCLSQHSGGIICWEEEEAPKKMKQLKEKAKEKANEK